MKTIKTKTQMNVSTFEFGKPHFIVAAKGGRYKFKKLPNITSYSLYRHIVRRLLQDLGVEYAQA